MARTRIPIPGWRWGLLLCLCATGIAQSAPPLNIPGDILNVSGDIMVNGREARYTIRHLPPASFPSLPEAVSAGLGARGCLVPQTYEAHQPENAVHASLERAGSSDWAVLCSEGGNVSLLVFFGASPGPPLVLASAPETERLSLNTTTGVYGFNWAIDPVSPERIRQARIGSKAHLAAPDHDALADSVLDRRTVYHFYANSAWTLLDLPER